MSRATPRATKRDAIAAAMSLAEDVSAGKLSPAVLEAEFVSEVAALVGVVVGEDDPLWPLQQQIARGVLALGGIGPDELSEWLAVSHQRAALAAGGAGDAALPPEPGSSLSEPLDSENDVLELAADVGVTVHRPEPAEAD